MAKAKGGPIDGLQFNVLAIVLALIILPGAVAFISSSGGYADASRDWESMFQESYSYDPADSRAMWVENGDDYSPYYEADTPTDGYCSYLTPFVIYYPECSGQGTGTTSVSVTDYLSYPPVVPDYTGTPTVIMPDSHFPLAGSFYHTTSGDGPFSWFFSAPDAEIIPDEQIQSFRWFMFDNTDYDCDSAIFSNFSYDLSVYFFEPNLLGTGGIWFNQTIEEASNQVTYWKVHGTSGELETACFVGLDVQLDLDVFEQIQLRDHFNGDYSQMAAVLRLDNFDLEGIAWGGLGSTPMPFLGADSGTGWGIHYQYSSTSYSEATFYLKGGTLVIAIGVFLTGLASTPYWDPFRKLFRGAFD